jgi:hypothetical protein
VAVTEGLVREEQLLHDLCLLGATTVEITQMLTRAELKITSEPLLRLEPGLVVWQSHLQHLFFFFFETHSICNQKEKYIYANKSFNNNLLHTHRKNVFCFKFIFFIEHTPLLRRYIAFIEFYSQNTHTHTHTHTHTKTHSTILSDWLHLSCFVKQSWLQTFLFCFGQGWQQTESATSKQLELASVGSGTAGAMPYKHTYNFLKLQHTNCSEL